MNSVCFAQFLFECLISKYPISVSLTRLGQLRAQQPPTNSLGSQQPFDGSSTAGMSSVPLNQPTSSQPQPPQTMSQQAVPRPQNHGLPPPPTGQTTGPLSHPVAPPVTAGQIYKVANPSLPPPPNPGLAYQSTGTSEHQQNIPPPPISGQLAGMRQTLPPPPPGSQPGLDFRQPPPTSAQLASGPQFPTPGQPLQGVQAPGQTYPAGGPPPTGGQAPPSATRPSLPPPPMAGQLYQPPAGIQQLPPPPPQHTAPPPSGQGLMAGPMTGSHLGQRPHGTSGVLTQPGPAPGAGGPVPPSGGTAVVILDS